MADSIVKIDGAMLEGGGQILRNAAALSCLLHKPITVNNIRAGRNNPGLRPQHLTGLYLLRDIANGRLDGGNVGSTEITLFPKAISGGEYTADTKTAGSICLLVQAALPCLLYGTRHSSLSLCGGTNAEMAPQIDYLTWVLGPLASRFGVNFDCNIERRGYFPKGGGKVTLGCQPVPCLQAVELVDRGEVTKITGRAFVAGVLPIKVSHIMAGCAKEALQQQYGDIPIDIQVVKEPQHMAIGTGTGIIVMAETSTGCRLAGSALGKKGVRAEDVGYRAGEMLLTNLAHGGCVDEYLQDQLIILMALADGTSRVSCGPISLHTQTAIAVSELLTEAKFNIQQLSENQNIIECVGIGFRNQQK